MDNYYKKVSSFDEKDRLPDFMKDTGVESYIQEINSLLSPLQQKIEGQVDHNYYPHPIVLILGVPRSGTTLISQLICSRLDVGYPSNLMARFYEVPAIGAFLQHHLLKNSIQKIREYCSQYGVTSDITEPHEFGYFWARHFFINQNVHEPSREELKKVNITKLTQELNSISNTFNKAVVMKCPLACYFIPVLKKINNIVFINLERNFQETAFSIFNTRLKRMGDENIWWSIRPKNFDYLRTLPVFEQIVRQIDSVTSKINKGLEGIADDKKISISYEELIYEPEKFVLKLRNRLKEKNAECNLIGEPLRPLKPKPQQYDNNMLDKLNEVLKKMNK